jgi:hypothetical protein
MADQLYDWTFTSTGGTLEGSGTLTTGAADDGGYVLTGITGTIEDGPAGVTGPITGFTPGSGDDGVFAWDNIIYTGTPHVDNLGILFDADNQEVNIYSATGGCCDIVYPGAYPKGDIQAGSNNNFGGDAGTFAISAAPEPATWALLFLGVGMAGGALRMAKRRMVSPVAA